MYNIFMYDLINKGKSISEEFRSSLSDKKNDIHAKLMAHYPEISEWW